MDGGDPAGGSAELARLIDKCGESLLADFLYYYRLDIRDVLIPGSGLTPRMCIALVRNLPAESATVAAYRGGDEFRGWGQDRYMIAELIDAVRELTYVQVSSKSKRKPPRPTPFSRPKAKKSPNKDNKFMAMARAQLMKRRSN